MPDKIRVRYAPSPTGLLHIGNARTALFNYLFARRYNGKFIIRIEDTDVKRNVEGGEQSQLKYLKWLGINWDEGPDILGNYGPYHQLDRLDLYQKYANILVEKGFAYKDFSDQKNNKYCIRMKSQKGLIFSFDDIIRGHIEFKSEEVEDWVIMKENKIPTYNFAVVIDDHLMEITHILRGEEHITNTPKQIQIYKALNWEIPLFGHMTIIVNEKHKKLSKRDENVIQFISQYEKLGYLPDALLNFIALLGFAPKSENEILKKDELIKLFDKDRLTKAPSMFDVEKLNFINKKHFEKLDFNQVKEYFKNQLLENKIEIPSELWLNSVVKLFHERVSYAFEVVFLLNEFISKKDKLTKELVKLVEELNGFNVIKLFDNKLTKENFLPEKIKNIINEIKQELNVKGKDLFMPIRIGTTFSEHGPSLEDVIFLKGFEKVKNNLKEILKKG